MSNLEKVLAEKGIKNDVAFIATYKDVDNKMMLHNGNLLVYSPLFRDYYEADTDIVLGIVLGDVTVREIGFPEYGDIYYVPDFFNEFKAYYWRGSKEDNFYKENKLVFKTKEQAKQVAKYFVDAAKHLKLSEEVK